MEYLKNKKILLFFLLFILLFFSISFIIYNKVSKNNKDEKEEIVDKIVEVESGNLEVNNSLSRKVHILERLLIDGFNDRVYSSGDIYSDKFYFALVSSESKLYSVLEQMYYEYQNPVTTNYNFGSLENVKNQMRQIDVDLVESEYKGVFGNFVDLHKSFEINHCPLFIYDSNNLKYYGLMNNCNYNGKLYLETFVNNITTKKDEAYVYVSLASIEYLDDGNRRIYVDYNRKNLYEGILIGTDKIINSNNYKLFSQYKYVFKKDKNNNYYFMSIEKIN